MKKTLLILSALLLSVSANASDNFQEFLIQQNITISQITSKATTKVKPDTFKTTVEFSTVNRSAEKAQLDLNKKIKIATKILKKTDLEYKVGNFNSYKRYKSTKHRSRQTIEIKSNDKKTLESVVTTLQQNDAKVTSTYSYVSQEQKNKQYKELFEQAYKDAKTKADFIVKQTGANDYVVTNLSQRMDNGYYRRQMFNEMAMVKSAGAEKPIPKIEIDNSEKEISLEVTLSIAIENDED